MNMTDIRKMAKERGIKSFGKSKVALVREIQLAEGNFDCFGRMVNFCDQYSCCFRAACLKESARSAKNRL